MERQIKIYPSKDSTVVHEYNKKYYEENKDKLLERAKDTVVCQCGKNITKSNFSKHLKTPIHLKSLAKLNDLKK